MDFGSLAAHGENDDIKQLCLDLLAADSEDHVIALLKKAGYWDAPQCWRLIGNRSGNFATIGNQQSRPDAALVEKIVNSVDARLMNECQVLGVDPTSDEAPPSIKHAVARFFGGKDREGDIGGSLREWTAQRRTKEAANITLAATGAKRSPCLTLVDLGEGQTPDRIPDTFMSIEKENKLRIPFVQGKFNMGGTGVLKFCGKYSLQLVITRRNPKIIEKIGESDPSGDLWGFTIVRRERPKPGIGAVKNSVYTYLAPRGADTNPHEGGVLRFAADSLPLMPEYNKPYQREVEWGSAVKLYNYDMKGFSSHILMKDGLLYRLEALLPEIALPVRMHECRDYGGKTEGSFVTNLAGLVVRLEEGKGGNLEEGFPTSVPFTIHGQDMIAKIYAFKKGKAETYRTNEGVIFSINGQTHGSIPKTLFERKKVKMHRLADALLVTVDCSSISVDAREDLFMNSRDRLSAGELRNAIERQIEDIVRNHAGLRALRERRRAQEIESRLEDSKPLEDVLTALFKSSPTLASLFLKGHRLSSPLKTRGGKGKGKGEDDGDRPFKGKPHPTFFRFNKCKDGEEYVRDAEIGRRCRLKFETDVVNDYFIRAQVPGKYEVEVLDGLPDDLEINHSLTLHDGFANWSVEIPDDVNIGDTITIMCTVNDETLAEPFVNTARLTVIPKATRKGGNGQRSKRTSGGGDAGESLPTGITMPHIVPVREKEAPDCKTWAEEGFDQYSGCKIMQDTITVDGKDATMYTFYINFDNAALLNEMKESKQDPILVEAKFKYGNVLLGLALIQDFERRGSKGGNGDGQESETGQDEQMTVEKMILATSRAIAPFLVPMIDYLGSLSADEVASSGEIGDDS